MLSSDADIVDGDGEGDGEEMRRTTLLWRFWWAIW